VIQKIIGGIARTLLAFYGGKLVESGLITSDDLSTAIGAIIFFTTLGWSMWQKYRATKKYDPHAPFRRGIPLK